MRKLMFAALISAGGLFIAGNAAAQDFSMPAASPSAKVHQQFSTSFIEISYSRPSIRGREIFGGLVPYGKVWRTGANAATNVTFGEDVEVNGHPLKAGSYALYTIPGEKEWKIIFNTDVDNWGDAGYTKNDNVVSFMVPAQTTEATVQSFRISIEDITDSTCNIVLHWANTKVTIPVLTHNDARIMAYLDQALQGDKPPYHAAANYYLKTNRKLDKALAYAQKAIDANPKAFYLHWLKARIYAELGQKEEALAEAKLAAEGAAGSAFAGEYKRHYEQLKADLK